MSDLGSPQDQEDRRREYEEGVEWEQRRLFWQRVRRVVGFGALIVLAIWYQGR